MLMRIFLLSDPKLTKALNTVGLEEQEPGDLVDAERIEAIASNWSMIKASTHFGSKDKPDLTDIKLSKLTKRGRTHETALAGLLPLKFQYWHRRLVEQTPRKP